MNPKKMEIDNIRFKESVYTGGAMNSNVKVGWRNCTLTMEPMGVRIDIPEEKAPGKQAPALSVIVPYSNIKQIELKV